MFPSSLREEEGNKVDAETECYKTSFHSISYINFFPFVQSVSFIQERKSGRRNKVEEENKVDTEKERK